jgi:hypothetical protein
LVGEEAAVISEVGVAVASGIIVGVGCSEGVTSGVIVGRSINIGCSEGITNGVSAGIGVTSCETVGAGFALSSSAYAKSNTGLTDVKTRTNVNNHAIIFCQILFFKI